MCNAAWLSQMSCIGLRMQNFNSWSSCFIHTSSQVVRAIARYSASALDLATTFCFLLFQEMRFPPMRTQYPEVDLLSLGDPAQSASVYATMSVWPLFS